MSGEPSLPALQETTNTVDARGTVFRPGFHRVNADGSPFRGRFGQFMPKGGRRRETAPAASAEPSAPSESAATEPPATVEPSPAPKPAAEPPPADFTDVEKIAADAVPPAGKATDGKAELVDPLSLESSWDATLRGAYSVSDGVLRGRGEWKPEDNAEHLGLRDTWVACSRAYGWKPLPPILAAIGASLAYVWKRLTSPNTSRTLVKWFPSLAPILGVDVPAAVERPAEKPAAQPAPTAEPSLPAAPSVPAARGGSVHDGFFG